MLRRFGVGRILLANELTQESAIRWIAAELDADPHSEFFCLVDSVEGVRRLTSVIERTGTRRPLSGYHRLWQARCSV
jgi:D-serine deaminase-like pyridoxal phosphate-dependent protein